jgi:hypothetical protein
VRAAPHHQQITVFSCAHGAASDGYYQKVTVVFRAQGVWKVCITKNLPGAGLEGAKPGLSAGRGQAWEANGQGARTGR